MKKSLLIISIVVLLVAVLYLLISNYLGEEINDNSFMEDSNSYKDSDSKSSESLPNPSAGNECNFSVYIGSGKYVWHNYLCLIKNKKAAFYECRDIDKDGFLEEILIYNLPANFVCDASNSKEYNYYSEHEDIYNNRVIILSSEKNLQGVTKVSKGDLVVRPGAPLDSEKCKVLDRISSADSLIVWVPIECPSINY